MNKNLDAAVLVAEDDDFLLTEKAFQDCDFAGSLHRVKDGEELMKFLLRARRSPDAASRKMPLLLLLDLNMPRKDGREALRELKAHPILRKVPVVVPTTAAGGPDVLLAYELGADSFIRKPTSFDEFADCIKSLKKYWLEVSELPRWNGAQGVP